MAMHEDGALIYIDPNFKVIEKFTPPDFNCGARSCQFYGPIGGYTHCMLADEQLLMNGHVPDMSTKKEPLDVPYHCKHKKGIEAYLEDVEELSGQARYEEYLGIKKDKREP